MNINQKHIIYFIGIGGIGMSALAKYFLKQGKIIAGYDCTRSEITVELENAGAYIHYDDNISDIPDIVKSSPKQNILAIYTPAIPQNSPLLLFIVERGIQLYKRAEVLGLISNLYNTIAIAGTHGKTTVSSLIAHIINHSTHNNLAFVGGIIKNYHSNFIYNKHIDYVIVEADEYDRSFLQLNPHAAIITSIAPDHLDIYKTYSALKEAYNDFAKKIISGGKLLINKNIDFFTNLPEKQIEFYSVKENANCTIINLRTKNGLYIFDVKTPWGNIKDLHPKITGYYNIENVLAATSLCLWLGIDKNKIKEAVEEFQGVRRRFDVQVHSTEHIYIDDYAHHPEEIKAFIDSVRTIFPNRKITGIFQPHLYSRTRDFATEFAQSLSLLDELWLMNIYPARELPIKGITSKIIYDKVTIKDKHIVSKEELLLKVKKEKPKLLLTMGAGDIDQFVKPIKRILSEK